MRRICLHLRTEQLPRTYIETVENHRLELAQELIQRALDGNGDGVLSAAERSSARIVIYGQSLGGSATIQLCRWLQKQEIPVLLNVQIDSVGFRDGKVPSNVKAAANLYQREMGPIRGRSRIQAEDARKTVILGNWRYRYPRSKKIDVSEETPLRQLLMNPHVKMEFDPEVWQKVEDLIRSSIASSGPAEMR
ncbi:hypothetical protein [Bryobacter aggregatus]|uniref:hypothetical protein n=1 Tax=Bryobacter aggregatus TaxID=360054 RepID=UPI0012BAE9F1|nr:hypothetical protein [Bryobacter aggregatus]